MMKETNTIIVNSNTMNEIANEWWSKLAYSSKSKVTKVDKDLDGNFEITLEEIVKTEE